MPDTLSDHFVTSPHLLCLEKTQFGLSLSHFGNVSIHSSKVPDLSLSILRALKRPKSLTDLHQELDEYGEEAVTHEFSRLKSTFLIRQTLDESSAQNTNFRNSKLAYFSRDPEVVADLSRTVASTRIAVFDFIRSEDAIEKELRSIGFRNITVCPQATIHQALSNPDELSSHDLCIVIGEPRHRLSFSKLNQKFFELRKRWLLVTLDMFGGVLGPTFGLDGGPCYDCLVDCSIRQFDRAFEKTEFKDFLKEEGDHELNAMPLAQIVLSYAALEAVKIRSQMITPKTFDGFYTFDMFNFRMNYSAVSPSPRCPVCSAHARSPNL